LEHHPPTWRASPPWSHPISDSRISAPPIRGAAAAVGSEADRRHPDEPAPPKPELLREFCGHLAKPDDETVLLADGRAVEIPVF
jgi:hypothetical protein